MSDVKNDDIVNPEVVVPDIILVDDVKDKEEVVVAVVAAVEAPVVAEADGTEPEEADKEDTNDSGQNDNGEAEHKNGEATPKENGDSNGTAKEVDVEIKRKSGGGDEPIEPVVEGVSPEKKLKLAESENTEKEDVVEANGEPTAVSS